MTHTRFLCGITAVVMSSSPINAMPQHWSRSDLASVRHAAKQGDKAAQLELGDRYRTGRDFPPSEAKARRWYRQAARDVVQRKYVYSGPVGNENHGRPIQVGSVLVIRGLDQAKSRLETLSNPLVQMNISK